MAQAIFGSVSIIADAAMDEYVRVKIDSAGEAVVAGAGERGFGIAQAAALAAGDKVAVRPHADPGAQLITVSEAVAIGDRLRPGASGKYAKATVTGPFDYVAIEAGSGDGSVIAAVYAPSVFAIKHTVTAAEAAANSGDGQADIDTGFGTASFVAIVTVLNVTTGIQNTGYAVTQLTGGDAGKVRVAGVAAGVQLDEGDIIHALCL